MHASETLSVAVDTLGALQQRVSRLPSRIGQSNEKSTEASFRIQAQIDSHA
jgi:hypothetical protein